MCLAVATIGLVAVGLWLRAQLAPVGAGQARVVQIPAGADSFEIASRLKQEGLIRNEIAFQVGLQRWGLRGKLKAGYFELSPAMSPQEIAQVIASGRQATVKVTIPEGFTLAQIARRIGETNVCSAEEFTKAATPERALRLDIPLPTDRRLQSLEGYLFPATYVFEYGTDPRSLVDEMLKTFRARVIEGLATDLAQSRFSLHEVVTIASMIEREARVPQDRPLIASVIYNRLSKGLRLQIDATVLYALGKHKDRLSHKDLRVDSPFNTYRHTGLPPHPICSPGEASLRAALHPAKTDYLYYVARPDGSHVFTRTYAQHLKAIRAIRGG